MSCARMRWGQIHTSHHDACNRYGLEFFSPLPPRLFPGRPNVAPDLARGENRRGCDHPSVRPAVRPAGEGIGPRSASRARVWYVEALQHRRSGAPMRPRALDCHDIEEGEKTQRTELRACIRRGRETANERVPIATTTAPSIWRSEDSALDRENRPETSSTSSVRP